MAGNDDDDISLSEISDEPEEPIEFNESLLNNVMAYNSESSTEPKVIL